MQSSESIAALAAALVSAQKAMGKAGKNAENPHLKSKYANLAEVWDTCQEVLPAHGLAVMQLPAPFEGNVLALETVLMHSSGEWVSSTIVMPLAKADPQGYGSALTYARRYGLAAAVGVVQDDDDGHAASQGGTESRTAHAPAPAPRQNVPQNGGGGNGSAQATRQQWFKALEDAGLLEPDPTDQYPDRQKPSGEWYGVGDKAGLPRSWSKYTPEQYGQAIQAIHAHAQRHQRPPSMVASDFDYPNVEADPFADQ